MNGSIVIYRIDTAYDQVDDKIVVVDEEEQEFVATGTKVIAEKNVIQLAVTSGLNTLTTILPRPEFVKVIENPDEETLELYFFNDPQAYWECKYILNSLYAAVATEEA